jgi:outer membrane translocation and assembly module TamA
LRTSDHFGAHAKIANPEVKDEELRAVTVREAYWKNALPAAIQAVMKNGDPANSDFYIGIQEYIPRYENQMLDFEAHAGHRFVLASPGHPDLHATLSGMTLSNGAQYQMWGVRIDAESRKDIATGAEYAIRPINTSATYTWGLREGIVVRAWRAR